MNIFLLWHEVLFIHQNCFGVSCPVLKISSVCLILHIMELNDTHLGVLKRPKMHLKNSAGMSTFRNNDSVTLRKEKNPTKTSLSNFMLLSEVCWRKRQIDNTFLLLLSTQSTSAFLRERWMDHVWTDGKEFGIHCLAQGHFVGDQSAKLTISRWQLPTSVNF